MDSRAKKLFQEINESETKLYQAQKELDQLQKTCRHEWGEVQDCSVYIPEKEVAGDRREDMKIDWQPGYIIPAQTIKKWKRTCVKCGLTQETDKTENKVTQVVKF